MAAIRGGSSWSGRERNGAFLNLGDGRFVDAAGISGFDFVDDARCVARVDWNRDGRLDVWVKNRTGPQLRFLQNDLETSNTFVSLKLVGVRANRDAIGAVVELTAGGRSRVGQVSAGSGYLGQSSSTVHFGLADATKIERLTVRWPGGEAESIAAPEINGFYRVVEGSGRAQRIERARAVIPAVKPHAENALPPTRLLLKTPLPLPPRLLRELGALAGKSTLVSLWAHWCEPCAGEIRAYAGRRSDLEAHSIRWSPVSLDRAEDQAAAADWLRHQYQSAAAEEAPAAFLDPGSLATLEALLEHVTGRSAELPLPAGLLIDERGNLQMLYLGPVLPDRFLSDASIALDPAIPASRRSLYPGRWYYRSPRNTGELSRRLKELGRPEEAAFYDRQAP